MDWTLDSGIMAELWRSYGGVSLDLTAPKEVSLSASGSIPFLPSSSTNITPEIDPTKVSVTFIPSDGSSPLPVLVNGEPEDVDEDRAKEILMKEDVGVEVDLGMPGDGEGEAKYWTCDFSYVSCLPPRDFAG